MSSDHERGRPPFIITSSDIEEQGSSYPGSEEELSYGRPIGLHLERLEPGQRTSWPHAEEKEEEFVYVTEGSVDAWVDGELYPMKVGDLAAFPAGTGICHTFINNSDAPALLLVGGERVRDNRIYYPLHPQRRRTLPWSVWWEDVPVRNQGAHDGVPDLIKNDE
jgi:uncharacterized cupin superfamily protein